jgi:hypothetical protein
MFTCIDDLRVNVEKYLGQYKKQMDCLVNQKIKDRTEKIEKIMKEVKCNNIFEFSDDGVFKEKFFDCIKELLQIKPGRLLIKELLKLRPNWSSVPILFSKRDLYNADGRLEINLDNNDESENYYNALTESNETLSSKKPKMIILAHELIHVLHQGQLFQEEKARWAGGPRHVTFQGYTFMGYEGLLVMKKFSDREEQHTILGLNIPKFLETGELDKIDILSENVFLLALKYLPRIDHQKAEPNKTGETLRYHLKKDSRYYEWLTDRLNERNKKVDEQFNS